MALGGAMTAKTRSGDVAKRFGGVVVNPSGRRSGMRMTEGARPTKTRIGDDTRRLGGVVVSP